MQDAPGDHGVFMLRKNFRLGFTLVARMCNLEAGGWESQIR